MRRVKILILLIVLPFGGCNKRRSAANAAFTGDVRIVAPFAQPSVNNGHIFLSNGRLRVELGPMVLVYIVKQGKGWEMFPQLKQYVEIGEKQISTYLPSLTNGSPCLNSERPAQCKMLRRESVSGRQATKWLLVNQHSVPVYLWTDDQIGIALRWQIENVTYEVSGIREGSVADKAFELPAGYTLAPEKWRETFGSGSK